mmetsp:Transcript_28551/g.66857  ORF Transcript_28551/g.66857 Transcript_28551/m.66857 type:complete len:688 (+) Transcript_28551:292-2355(+)|eukprot:CAMPEP_0168747780 /NCGR_PEP_ID=MMETSP0724-20121128/15834_1 /TAXON_ID=265536 /ORGANISM="Amphiprora sp., Strain CCMP467" /LENGTH=687 /DNA_ID=CAMNT_0008795583 /DNA_START=190 /DNA_END=2253 /DNA_ORIENTATION=+
MAELAARRIVSNGTKRMRRGSFCFGALPPIAQEAPSGEQQRHRRRLKRIQSFPRRPLPLLSVISLFLLTIALSPVEAFVTTRRTTTNVHHHRPNSRVVRQQSATPSNNGGGANNPRNDNNSNNSEKNQNSKRGMNKRGEGTGDPSSELSANGSSSSSNSDGAANSFLKYRGRPLDVISAGACNGNSTLLVAPSPSLNGNSNDVNHQENNDNSANLEFMQHRITQLEELVAKQAVDIKRLQEECKGLTEAATAFTKIVELLRDSGLSSDLISGDVPSKAVENKAVGDAAKKDGEILNFDNDDDDEEDEEEDYDVVFLNEDDEIFGKAPSSVHDAADAAGAAILAALLGGQQRMLVDVRDAELTSSAETLVQFIELAVLPVAAGLDGLYAKRNRLKIVFPTVKQLLQYRKTMALAAPEVVALSTLGLDPVEEQDNLVFIIAPSPDDEEGCQAMNQMLKTQQERSGDESAPFIRQPVVVFNPYMSPIQGPAASYEVAYHLRLLSVQYMASSSSPGTGFVQSPNTDEFRNTAEDNERVESDNDDQEEIDDDSDEALKAAMEHARSVNRPNDGSTSNSIKGGTTRSMVIRAYPKPWHVYVDTSPDTDADFTIAGSFDNAPTPHDIQTAIIECLEGSEREDEIVAQQMQTALESGQLDRVNEMLGSMGLEIFEDEDDDDDDDDPWGLYDVDSV